MTKHRLNSSEWYSHVARVTKEIGQDDFGESLLDALCFLAPCEGTTIFLYPHQGLPITLFDRDEAGPWLPEGSIKNYLRGYYLLDPFYRACIDKIEPGCYQLIDVAPDQFKRSEFFLSFYQYCHLKDELNYIVHLNDDLTVAVALASKNRLTKDEINDLKCINPWVQAIVTKQWGGVDFRTDEKQNEKKLYKQINSALNNFGCSILTARECEVAQLLLRGHSTKLLAAKINISVDTVKTHRRNIYIKLDISKQSELFSLFIDSLSQICNDLDRDPLETYL